MLNIAKNFILFFLVLDLKFRKKGLMSFTQYWGVAKIIRQASGGNILVFGLGNDSLLWHRLNGKGRIVFLEDSKIWIKQFENLGLDIRHVKYPTKVQDASSLGFYNEKYYLPLEPDILAQRWDIILVDAPLGHQPPRPWAGPGRMCSLYMAKMLAQAGSKVIVDDFGRSIEHDFSMEYFGCWDFNVIGSKVAIFEIGSADNEKTSKRIN